MNAEPYRPGERRPIASRERKSSQIAAQWLARRKVSPNTISVSGMVCGLASGLAFAATSLNPSLQRWGWILGAVFAQLRLLANMFDGMVAVATGRASPVGELYNEVPDRVSDAAILIGLGCALGGDIAMGIAAAGVAIFTAYVRAIGKVAGAPQEFCGPMAKPHRMFLVTLLGIYNGLSPSNWQPLWSGGHGLAAMVLVVIIVGGLLTAGRRLLRTAAALRKLRS
ncbi:MAG TPA: CDP-alcohol phosphatidyltransferase family protein [Verrucomicrobiae bacterium]|nr:CDP-alcohol phosphatidyltransferase family protein [Verrucomicrobiae bacterium]